MAAGYGQFCPVAKASEVFATRWTPLVLRELMSGERSFNDIHRGVPLMSRALLVERLRLLEEHGIVARVPKADGAGQDYRLTPAGDGLRAIVDALGRWGLRHGSDQRERADNDPALLLWALRRRADPALLPDRRVVAHFEFSGVPPHRARMRLWWLVLERAGVDVCSKDPGFPVDVTLAGNIAGLVACYLGRQPWRAAMQGFRIEGDRAVARDLPRWLRLDLVVGRDLPIVPPA